MSAANADVARLYTDHNLWLQMWLRKRLGNTADAADIAHDTYVRIIEADIHPPLHESRRYLSRIAGGLAIDLVRRRQIEAAYLDALAARPVELQPSEEVRAIAVQALMEVDVILHKLTAKSRTALLMYRLEGMTYREIADKLQVSPSSVEKYIASAMVACLQAAHRRA